MLKLILMLICIAWAGFQTNGLYGVLDNFKALFTTIWELLKLVNIISFKFSNGGVLTNFFGCYFIYFLVGLTLELFNIPKGTFGKLFGKLAYWLIGIPVSFVLNILSNLLFG